jgi:hypothetical protein
MDERPPPPFDIKRYNCWDYAREQWFVLTGRDIGQRTPEVLTRAALLSRFDSDVPTFRELERPAEPCLVLFEQAGAVPHVGVFTRGRVRQLRPGGACALPLRESSVGYQRVRFFDDG